MIEAGITGAAVALLNAVRELIDNKNWKPLAYTLASGVIAALVTWFATEIDVIGLKQAFILGAGGSGVYTLVSKVGSSTPNVPVVG